jgi:hypothetical protein
MIHQPVEQIRIVVFQQADEQLFVVIAERIVLMLKNGMMEISSSRIPRRHAQWMRALLLMSMFYFLLINIA